MDDKKIRNKKRNKLIILSVLLLGISIGFAALSTTLRINGFAGVKKAVWKVYWSNPQVISGSVSDALPVIGQDQGDSEDTKATWSVTFTEPGQYYGFTIDATNGGTIDAIIKNIQTTTTPVSLPEYITYSVTHADGSAVVANEFLAKANDSTPTRKKYKVMVVYDPTVEQYEDIPNEGITIEFETEPVYEQKPKPKVTPEPTKEKVVLKSHDTNLSSLSDAELTEFYGEDVTGFSTIYPLEWQLFYSDSDNVYLITKDYVRNNYLPEKLEKEEDNDSSPSYNADFGKCAIVNGYQYIFSDIVHTDPWQNGASSTALTSNPITSKYLKWVANNSTNINENVRATAYMMDTSVWANFAGNVEGAFAMGGPTLEMFALSYNAKHDNKMSTYEEVNSTNSNSYGYKTKMESDTSWGDYGMTISTAGENNMWVITSTDKASFYWLATPSASNTSSSPYLYYISVNSSNNATIYGAYIGQNVSTSTCGASYGKSGFRPVVAIPKSSLK